MVRPRQGKHERMWTQKWYGQVWMVGTEQYNLPNQSIHSIISQLTTSEHNKQEGIHRCALLIFKFNSLNGFSWLQDTVYGTLITWVIFLGYKMSQERLRCAYS